MVRGRRVEILDLLRGIAALSVAWYHFAYSSNVIKTPWLAASGRYGSLGVEIFFVISGFIIPYSMYLGGYHAGDFGKFVLKRLIRLEPPYVASILVAIFFAFVAAAAPGFAGAPPHFTTHQLLLHLGYLNTFFGYEWVNPVYWTLGIEFQFYIIAALIFPLLTSRSSSARVLYMVIVGVIPLFVKTPMLAFHYFGLFGLGVLAFHYHAGSLRRDVVPAVLIMGGLTMLSLGFAPTLAGVSTAFIIMFVPLRHGWWSRPLLFAGGISYSIYLLHVPIGSRIVNFGARRTHSAVWEMVLLAFALGATVAVAVLFNWCIERPAQRASGRIKYRSSPQNIPADTSGFTGASKSADWSGFVSMPAHGPK